MKKFDKISGERLFLEALDPKGFSSAYSDWMQDEEVLRFLTGRTKPYSRQELEAYIVKMNESPVDYLFGIFLKAGGLHIGNIKIGSIDLVHQSADLGLLIGNKDMWGKGYATEAIGLATQYAFDRLGLSRITAGMVSENIGSYKAFVKAGYSETAAFKKQVSWNGIYVETKLLEKVGGQ